MSGSTGKAGLRENAPRPSDCSTLTDALTFIACCVCFFFFSHVHKTTTWQDPRLSQLQSAAAQHPVARTPIHAHSFSNPAPTTQPKNIIPETGITPAMLHPFFLSSVSLEYVGWYFFGIPSWLLTLIHLFTCAYATYYINLNQGLVSFLTVN